MSGPKLAEAVLARLKAQAIQQYPYIQQYDPIMTSGGNQDDWAETWRPGDAGDPTYPRPANIPLNRVGVQVFNPKFSANDLAAEMLHVDPFANATRNLLGQSLSPQQIQTLQHGSGDYIQSIKPKDQGGFGMSQADAMNNAIDAAMRGTVFNQWPDSANQQMNYNQTQSNLLNALRSYTKNAFYPSDYQLPRPGLLGSGWR